MENRYRVGLKVLSRVARMSSESFREWQKGSASAGGPLRQHTQLFGSDARNPGQAFLANALHLKYTNQNVYVCPLMEEKLTRRECFINKWWESKLMK